MVNIHRFSELSEPRKALVRLLQSLNFGVITVLNVRNREPIFDPPPQVFCDIKLDSDGIARPEYELEDFAIRAEVTRLFQHFDEIGNGRIDRIEVRAGIPRRILFQAKMTEIPR